MAPLRGKEHFPEAPDQEGHGVGRQEVEGAVDQAIPGARRIKTGEGTNHSAAPAVRFSKPKGRQGLVGVVTDGVHTREHRREGAQPHRDHDSLQVDAVANVGGPPGDPAGLVERRINGLVERRPLFVLTALLEFRLETI